MVAVVACGFKDGQELGQKRAGFRLELVSHGLVVVHEPVRGQQEEAGHVGHLHEGLGARLEQGHDARQVGRVEVQAVQGASIGQVFRQQRGQALGRGLLDIVGVQPFQLLQVKDRGRVAQVVRAEQADEFLAGEDLLVAAAPAQPRQIVHQGLGQVAQLPVLHHRERAVALGQLGLVRAQDHGHMAEARHVPAQGLVQQYLARGVGHVVVAAQHVGHAHGVVVHHHGQVVRGRAVAAAQDHVVQLGVLHRRGALDHVVKGRDPVLGALEPHHPPIRAPGSWSETQLAAAAVVLGLSALGPGLCAHGLHLVRGAPAPVGAACGQQLVDVAVVEVEALALEHGAALGGQVEPGHGLDDGVGGLLGAAFAVGVLHAQQEGSALALGQKPAEQRGARAADVQVARGAGREAGDDGHGDASPGGFWLGESGLVSAWGWRAARIFSRLRRFLLQNQLLPRP